MEDTAAIYWCDMQGHVAAPAGKKCHALSPRSGRGRVYATYNLHHNRLDVQEARRGINERGGGAETTENAVYENTRLIYASFKRWLISKRRLSTWSPPAESLTSILFLFSERVDKLCVDWV